MGVTQSKKRISLLSDNERMLAGKQKKDPKQMLIDKFGTIIKLYKTIWSTAEKLGDFLILDLNLMIIYDPDSKQKKIEKITSIQFNSKSKSFVLHIKGYNCWIKETDSISTEEKGYKYVFFGNCFLKLAKYKYYIKNLDQRNDNDDDNVSLEYDSETNENKYKKKRKKIKKETKENKKRIR